MPASSPLSASLHRSLLTPSAITPTLHSIIIIFSILSASCPTLQLPSREAIYKAHPDIIPASPSRSPTSSAFNASPPFTSSSAGFPSTGISGSCCLGTSSFRAAAVPRVLKCSKRTVAECMQAQAAQRAGVPAELASVESIQLEENRSGKSPGHGTATSAALAASTVSVASCIQLLQLGGMGGLGGFEPPWIRPLPPLLPPQPGEMDGISKRRESDGSGFEGSGFEGSGFDRSGFEGSGFEGSGFEGNGFNRSGFEGSGFKGSGFDGSGFEGSGFVGSGFDGCGFDGSGFDGSGFDGSGFQGSGFQGSGFQGSGFDGSGFDGSGFDGSGFDGSGFVALPDLDACALTLTPSLFLLPRLPLPAYICPQPLVEHNPDIAACALTLLLASQPAFEYLEVLSQLPLTLHSLEVVSRVAKAVDLPPDFIHSYASHCMRCCEETKVGGFEFDAIEWLFSRGCHPVVRMSEC
ncbi:unnamed protein product [Closterium sp. Naga37s-1]|nr:unnamed protein product [Closterium sp. Naga37s-1]